MLIPLIAGAATVFGLLSPLPSAAAGDRGGGSVGDPTVTLITGDRVGYSRAADGRETVAITPGPRESGTAPYFRTHREDSGYYVIPSDAEELIRTGRVDRELFDVRELRGDRIPVITSGSLPRIAALPGTERELALPAVSVVAAQVDASRADSFWTAFAGSTGRLWYDAPVKASLDRSVAQVGAPQVWQSGYDGSGVTVAVLDTGVDPSHPDLAGKVAATQNFTPDESAVDGNGHGTHVASTIAGTGAASGGSRRGVAPGATLLAGKVLGDSGSGSTSGILAGMDWAVRSGARVVNMSFGGAVTDGSDLLSQAVNTYSERDGVLFVAAAGNAGPTAGTVSSPGAADAALTVGAVDRADQITWFSSRGPRRGDGAVKPEITAPGLDIVAARAAGTSMGLPQGPHYTSASGTSMASPHVAGAAALIAQAHPQWRSQELKSALVGSAKPIGAHAFVQGAGRLDVFKANTQPVTASPSTLAFGSYPWPQVDRPPVTRSVTYRNDSVAPITLRLAAEARTAAGEPGVLTLSSDTVTVPANGTASVTVTVDPKQGPTGAFGGQLTASSEDGATVVRTPIGYFKAIPTRKLTVRLVDSNGKPGRGSFNAVRVDIGQHPANPFEQTIFDLYSTGGVVTADLPEGVYDLSGELLENSLTVNRTTFAVESEIDLRQSDAELELDSRDGVRLRPETAERTDPFAMAVGSVWKIGERYAYGRGFNWGHNPDAEVYGIPSRKAPSTPGRFTFETHWSLAPPLVSIRTNRDGGTFHPVYYSAPQSVTRLDGDYRVGLVDIGDGQDLTGRDVAGKIGLVTLTPARDPYGYLFDRIPKAIRNAKQAGMTAVLLHVDIPGSVLIQIPPPGDAPIPALSLRYAEGVELRRQLSAGPVELRVSADESPHSSYQLHYDYPSGVPASAPARVRQSDLATVPLRLHGDGVGEHNGLAFFAYTHLPPGGIVSIGVTGPAEHIAYVGPVNDRVIWRRTISQWQADGQPIQSMESNDKYPRAGWRPTEDWFGGPLVTGSGGARLPAGAFPQLCGFCREGDLFLPTGYDLDDGGHSTLTAPWLHQVRMYAGESELELHPLSEDYFGVGYFQLPPEPAWYRLQDVYTDPRGNGRQSRTEWKFQSAGRTPANSVPDGTYCVISRLNPDASCRPEPLIQATYELGTRLDNTVRGGIPQLFTLTALRSTGAALAISYDDGKNWMPVRLWSLHRGQYTAFLLPPRIGSISIKMSAWDSNENRIDQEIIRSYRIR